MVQSCQQFTECFSRAPDFAVDLQVEEDECEEGDDARDDDVVPPPGELGDNP